MPNTPTHLVVTPEDRVLRITLNRPADRNALNVGLSSELVMALERAQAHPDVRAILLDAKGEFFSAGLDLEEETQPDETVARLFSVASRLRKPLVAAVQGHAFSSGLGLIATAHVAVAAQGCNFGLTDIRLGIWPHAAFQALSLAVGARRALELSLTGRVFGAPEALQWGLIHYQTPAFELEDRAMQLAGNLADASPFAIREALGGPVADRAPSPDFLEGVSAIKQRRRPVWPSRE